MTAFITVCCTKLPELARAFLLVLVCGLTALGSPARAAEIEVANPQLAAGDEGYVLSADFNFEFNARLEEAVDKGVVLHFVVEFELGRPRWYWLDEKLLTRTQVFRLSYHALTRQYRLSTGALHQSFPTLGEALRMLARLRNWQVIDRALLTERVEKTEKGDKLEKPLLKVGEVYQATLRLRLDTAQLPKPFQIAALGSREWTLVSDWKPWSVTLPPLEAR